MSTKKKKGGNALSRQNEHLYVQSNQLVEAHYKEALTMWELFLFSKMCTMIELEDTDFKTYKIYIKDALDYLGVKKGGHNYKYVVEAAQRLLDRRITTYYVNEQGKTIAVDTHLVNSVHRLAEPEEDDSLFIALTFPPELKPMLLQLKDNFTMLDLDVFKQLKTPTSVRMYQLLASHLWKKDKKVSYELEELKRKLGVAEKYDQYGAFKVYVLNEAQKRLDENGYLAFTYKEIKKGKRVAAIEFHLTDKRVGEKAKLIAPSDAVIALDLLEDEAVHDRLIAELSPIVVIQFGVSLKVFSQLVKQNTEGGIRQAVKVTEKAVKSNRVENAAGFFVEAVRGKYQDAEEQKKAVEKQKIADNKTKIDIIKQAEQTQAQIEADYKRRENERMKNEVKQLMSDNPSLIEAALETMQRGMFSGAFNKAKTFDENLESPMFLGVLTSIIEKIR